MGRVLSFRETRSPPCPAQQSFPLTAPAPEVLKRLVYKRDAVAVTEINLSNCAALPWAEQAKVAFDDAEQGDA